MTWSRKAAALVLAATTCVNAQFPSTPEGVTVLESRFGDGVKISYKEVSNLKDLSAGFGRY